LQLEEETVDPNWRNKTYIDTTFCPNPDCYILDEDGKPTRERTRLKINGSPDKFFCLTKGCEVGYLEETTEFTDSIKTYKVVCVGMN